jgi:hypothetical protein
MSESGVDLKVVMDKLAGLETSEAVARFLVEEGIQGYRSMAHACPVAKYLRRETGRMFEVHQGSYRPNWSGIDEVHETPGAVAEFIGDFDRGAYPELMCRDE